MKKTLLVGVVGVLGFILLTGFGFGGPGPMGHGHRPNPEKMRKFIDFKVNDVLDDLKATETQRTQVHAIKDRLLAEGKALHENRSADRALLLEQWKSEAPDAARIHTLVDQRADQMKDFAHKVADAALELHRLLTPEQRVQVAAEAEARMP